MSNAAVFTAGLACIALDGQRVRIDPRKLTFHQSRIEPSDPAELAARNERRLALADSWLERPINDIIARDGDYAVADGNERLAGILLRGVPEITVLLLPAATTDAELDEISLLTDFHKTSLKPIERAAVAKRLLDSTGARKADIAARLRIDGGYLTKLVSVYGCPPDVLEAARAGRIGPNEWYAVSKSPDPLETLGQFLSGASREAVQRSVKKRNKPDSDTVKMNSIVIAMPESRKLVLKGGVNLETAKDMLAAGLKLVEKAIDDGLSTKNAQGLWKDTAKKPKPERKKRTVAP